MKVLIVDDDADTRMLLSNFLHAFNQQVVAFSNAEAVWMYDGLDSIDIFLLDIVLPGLDGITLGRSLLATKKSNAFMIAVSGILEPAVAQALGAGFDAYIAKPLKIEHVEHVLVQASARRRAARSPSLPG